MIQNKPQCKEMSLLNKMYYIQIKRHFNLISVSHGNVRTQFNNLKGHVSNFHDMKIASGKIINLFIYCKEEKNGNV